MTLQELWNMIPPQWVEAGIVAAILSLVQISPMKLEPWTWLKSFVEMPKRIKALEKKADTQDDRLNTLDKKQDENMALAARIRIIRFADEVEMGMPKSGESYREVLRDIDRYRKYCDDNPEFQNSGAVSSIAFIEQKNQERRKKTAEKNEERDNGND